MSEVKLEQDNEFDMPSSQDVEISQDISKNIDKKEAEADDVHRDPEIADPVVDESATNFQSDIGTDDVQTVQSETEADDGVVTEGESIQDRSESVDVDENRVSDVEMVHVESESIATTNSPIKDAASGTKIGEMSDFEKDLIQSDVLEESTANLDQMPVEEAVKSSVSSAEQGFTDEFFESSLNSAFKDVFEGQIVPATVRLIKKSGILVDFSYKSDGFIPSSEISDEVLENLSEGDELYVMVQKLETKEGYSLLSEKSARAEIIWDEIHEKMTKKEVLTVTIQKVHQKGYLVSYDGIAGFLHRQDDDDLKENETVEVVIQNVDKRRKKVLFSSKDVEQLLKKKENVASYLTSISVGDQLKGIVTGIKKFGVFVNVGEVEGLVHISEIAWWRIFHPSDLVTVGDEVNVQVLAIDLEQNKLSLGMKQLKDNPWLTIEEDYAVAQDVLGKVIRLTTFGAFVLIDEKIEGLLHISEISGKRIRSIEEILTVGDTVNAKILKISKDEQKIGLTIKDIAQENQELAERINRI